MHFSIVASLFYIVVTLAAVSGFYLYNKSDKTFFAGIWVPVSFVALMGYQTFTAGIINLIKIKINIISVGFFNLVFAIVIWILIAKQKKLQRYKYEWSDIVVWLLIAASVLYIARSRYTGELLPTYNSVDAAVHFTSARTVVNSQHIWGMYYSALHNGLLIEVLGAFTKAASVYKIYVLGDVLHLILAGMMFWGVIRRYAKDWVLASIGIVSCLMYLLGYPLNSTLFGFSYLGMGITVIAYIIAVADIYCEDETDKKWGIILLAFGCFGIFQSYVLFMPVMFFSVLIFALVKQFLDKKLFSVNTIITGLGIFLPATLLGLWYTYGGIFGGSGKGGGGGTTVASAINIEGGIYSDLFSNFIFLIPIAFFGFISIIKNKKNKLITYVVALDIIFVLGLLRKALKREVSAYYYYKNYYMLWLLAWILFYIGICSLEKNSRFIAVFTMGLWILIAGMNWKNIEGRIAAKNPLLCQQFNTYNLSHIYGFNRTFIEITHYSADKVGIYTYVTDNIIDNDDSYVPLVGSIEDYFWMQAIINQSNSDFQYWNHGEDEFFNSLSADNVHYIMVFRDNSLYVNHSDYFEALNKIYENGAGFIGVVE